MHARDPVGYLIGLAIILMIGIAAFVLSSVRWTDAHGAEVDVPRFKLRTAIVAAELFLVLLITAVCSMHQVPTGEVGLTSTFGKIDGRTDPSAGLVFTAPWQGFETEDVRVNRQEIKLKKGGSDEQTNVIDAASAETQDVFIVASVVYHIDPQNVITLRQQVGDDVFGKIIQPQVITALKEETVKYEAIAILPAREKIRTTVKERVQALIAANKLGLTIDDVLLDSVTFSQQFNDAVERKQTATQDALTELEKVGAETNRQLAALEKARGERKVAEELATGQANANNLINASLTDRILQAAAIDKLSSNIQVALVPSGQGLIIDPSTLLTPKK